MSADLKPGDLCVVQRCACVPGLEANIGRTVVLLRTVDDMARHPMAPFWFAAGSTVPDVRFSYLILRKLPPPPPLSQDEPEAEELTA
jgi:hypothetical protein